MKSESSVVQAASAGHAMSPRKAAIAAWVGSALEYYDFFIYGSAAALVFNKIFFPAHNAAMATLLSLGTFGVAYLARPIGSFLMGHIGDKFGRKAVMIISLFGMGICTFLIGLLPTYRQIGYWAPVLLVLLRVGQGLAVSGEQAGASSMALEHAPENRRAFYSSFTLSGTQGGMILATAVFLPLSTLSDEALIGWGWRIPFLLSVVIMAFAWWIRRGLPEPPVFETQHMTVATTESPLKSLVKGGYMADIFKIVCAALASVSGTLSTVYALSYGVQTIGIPRSTMLWMQILSNIVALFAIPMWAIGADRFGRKPVFIIGTLGVAALTWPFILAITRADIPLVFTFGILSIAVYSAYGGASLALFSEQFETRVRLSGLAIGTQFGFALGGFAPGVAAALAGPSLSNWVPVAIFGSVTAVVAAISALCMRETHTRRLSQLGRHAG